MLLTAENGTNEIHGVYGREITPEFAHLLGQAVGTRLAGGRLVVGGDARPSTPELKDALIAGVLNTGCEVYDVGILPTPALYFAKDRLWADGAVMVTASHRPAMENGFKITLGKLPTTELEIHELLEAVRYGGPFASGAGRLLTHDILGPYISFLIARFIPADPLVVVVDALGGCMGQVVVPTLRFLQYQVIERNCTPNDHVDQPDPGLPEHYAALGRAVLTHQANLGVAYDGDGDRVVFVSEQGSALTPEQVLVLLARALLVYQPGSQVMYDASYASFVADEILKVGGVPVPLRATSVGIKRALLEKGGVLGGDLLGHYFFRTMGGDDALYATLVMLRFVSRYDGAIEQLLDMLR